MTIPIRTQAIKSISVDLRRSTLPAPMTQREPQANTKGIKWGTNFCGKTLKATTVTTDNDAAKRVRPRTDVLNAKEVSGRNARSVEIRGRKVSFLPERNLL